jgi:hypothetical protein
VKELSLFVLASVGLCHILVDSVLLIPLKAHLERLGFRKLVAMSNCYQCAGFWSGVVAGSIVLVLPRFLYLELLLYGFAASFLGPLSAVVIGYLNALVSAATAAGGGPEIPASAAAQDPAEGGRGAWASTSAPDADLPLPYRVDGESIV